MEIPSNLNATAFSYMSWEKIINTSSPQYELKNRYQKLHLIYDPDGMADIYGRKVIACTSKFGGIGDEVEIIFKNSLYPWRQGNSLYAVIGDEKDQRDRPPERPKCDEWGHIYGNQHCVIEFIVNPDVFRGNKTIKGTFNCLKNNPPIKIRRTGINFIQELRKK